MTVSIFKLTSGKWLHASVSDSTAYLRNRSDGEADRKFELRKNEDKEELDSILEGAIQFSRKEITAYLTEARLGFDKLGSYENREQWLEAFEILEQMASDGHAFESISGPTSPSKDERGNRLIPQTSLRRFYQTLRMFEELDVTSSIATYLSNQNRSEKLSTLIDDSVHHFRRYENVGEAFHGRDLTRRKVDNYVANPKKFANCLQARLRSFLNGPMILKASDGTNVGYVDYEISPYRTTGRAALEDGKIGSSGSGGLDLLLVDLSGDQPIPIIGEIKAATDRDLFLALIQSLVYAIEIGSTSQLRRLQQFYPTFENLAENSQVDIYLLFEGNTDQVALFDEAHELARQLFAYNGEFCNLVRSVKFIKVELGEDDQDVNFVVQNSVTRH